MERAAVHVETDHNVYILGAGFSMEAGIPGITGFLDALRDSLAWLEKANRKAEADAVREVLLFRKEAAAASDRVRLNVEDIEELFSLASATPGGRTAEYVTTAIAATIDYCRTQPPSPESVIITQMVEGTTMFANRRSGTEPTRVQWAPYEFYAAMMSGLLTEPSANARNTVITFNYDTILEDALKTIGVTCDYRLSGHMEPVTQEPILPVLKMHGSVNWGVQTSENAFHASPFSARESYAAVRDNSERVALIPPTWHKKFDGGLDGVWDAAVAAIEQATRVIIVGFSIPATDTHFKYLLAAGLRNNISLRCVLFVNPEADRLRPRVESVLRPDLFERGVVKMVGHRASAFFRDRADSVGRAHMAVIKGVFDGKRRQ